MPSGPLSWPFGDAFYPSLEKVTLPSGFLTLTFGDAVNQSKEWVTLPCGLRTCSFGDWFDRNLKEATMQSSVQTLTFGFAFNLCLEKMTMPSDRARPRQRCVLGVLNCYGSEGPSFKVLAINVTVLTRERLLAVMQQAKNDRSRSLPCKRPVTPRTGFVGRQGSRPKRGGGFNGQHRPTLTGQAPNSVLAAQRCCGGVSWAEALRVLSTRPKICCTGPVAGRGVRRRSGLPTGTRTSRTSSGSAPSFDPRCDRPLVSLPASSWATST